MSRHAEAPRLAQLDPAAVADEVLRLVSRHLAHFAVPLAPSYTVTGGQEPRSTDLWLTTEALVRYAQTGADAETSDPAIAASYARDRVQTICAALYSQAGRPGTFDAPDLDAASRSDTDEDGEPSNAIGCVLLAAWTRLELQGGAQVTVPALASLASVGPRLVRGLCESGEITRVDSRIAARDARRWLAARGVPGF